MPDNKNWGSGPWLAMTVAAGAAMLGLAYLAIDNTDRSVSVDVGGASFSVGAGASFGDVLRDAFEEDPGEVAALLTDYKFYHISDARLVTELSGLDPESEMAEDVRAGLVRVRDGLRQMLYNLEGPFRPAKETFAGADERLVRALEELDESIRESGKASRLLAEIWKDSIERKSLFRPRDLNAAIVVARGAGLEEPRQFYTCSDSDLIGRTVEVTHVTDLGDEVILRGVLTWNPARFRCTQRATSATEMLAGMPVRMATDPDSARILLNPGDAPFVSPAEIRATFRVRPRDLQSAF